MYRAVFVRDHDRIVVSDFALCGELLREGDRILRLRPGNVGDVARRVEGASAIGAAAQLNVNRAPIAAGAFARLAPRQHAAAFGDEQTRNAIERIAAFARAPEIVFFQQRSRPCPRPSGSDSKCATRGGDKSTSCEFHNEANSENTEQTDRTEQQEAKLSRSNKHRNTFLHDATS